MNDIIEEYIEKLVTCHPGIKSIWLFGSRANNSYTETSDWDLAVFADREILNALRQSKGLYDKRIDLLIVFNESDYEQPWPDEKGIKKGSLIDWKWKQLSSKEATYETVKYKSTEWFKARMSERLTLHAIKLWPKE